MFGWFKKKELPPPLLTEWEERIALGAQQCLKPSPRTHASNADGGCGALESHWSKQGDP